MRRYLLALPIVCLAAPAVAEPGGCLKYGAAGAAGGHFVGSGHAVAGAVAGCAIGSHVRNQAEQRNAQHAPANQPGPETQAH